MEEAIYGVGQKWRKSRNEDGCKWRGPGTKAADLEGGQK